VLRQRLVTGPLLIALVLGLVWLDERIVEPRGIVLFAVAALLVLLMAVELAALAAASGIAARRATMIGAPLVAFAAIGLPATLRPVEETSEILASVFVAIGAAAFFDQARTKRVEGAFAAIGAVLVAAIYAGVLLGFWMLVRAEHSAWVVIGAILTVKSCDIGAYFTGLAIGRHRLIPWLSPKKTWEGLVGGVLTAGAVGAGAALLSTRLPEPVDHVPWWLGLVGGLLLGVVGQLGDLGESLLKRGAGAKDSGSLLPGMGGVLDVLDSPLVTGPVVFWLLRIPHGSIQ
jgi:phosphatidate cytidylyltransferase